jgi:sugar lactone lactonase YvrE
MRFHRPSLAIGVSLLFLAGCPNIGAAPVGVTGTSAPGTGTGGGTPASAAPVAFGSPKFPKPKPIVPPPGVVDPGASGTGTPAPTSSASPTPVPSGVPLLFTPPQKASPLSYYDKPTLGEFVTTYFKDGANDVVTGKPVTLRDITAVAVDDKGDRYFTDTGNNAVRVLIEQVDPVLGVIKGLQTVATQLNEKGTDNQFIKLLQPRGIALKSTGDILVVDAGNQAVRLGVMGDNNTMVFTTLAGGGAAGYADLVGKDAQFNDPYGVCVDAGGNAYVTDTNNHCIRKITPAQVVTTLAGNGSAGNVDGAGKGARFSSPKGIAIDPKGTMYVADYGNNVIKKVTADGIVTLFAGSGVAGHAQGLGKAAQFNKPVGITVDNTGVVYVSEEGSQELRKITPEGAVTNLAGTGDQQPGLVDGPGITARFSNPRGLAVDKDGILYLADTGNNAIRQIQPVHVTTTLAGKGRPTAGLASVTNNPALFPVGGTCCNSGTEGFLDGNGQTAQFAEPWAVVADDNYNVYVADSVNNAIRKVAPDGTVTTLAGSGKAAFADGKGTSASFNTPRGLVLDGAGNLIVADQLNNCIRKVTPDGVVTTVAGDVDPNHTAGFKNGGIDVASFNGPTGVVLDRSGNLYVADRGNHVIRRITGTGQVTTFAGDGTAGYKDDPAATAHFASPSSLAIDGKGNIYVADYGNNAIRVVGPDGVVGTLAGSGIPAWADAAGKAAAFNDPWAMCVDDDGLVYVADYGNSLIRRIDGQGNTILWAGLIPGYPAVTANATPRSGYSDGPAIGSAFAAPAGICLDKRGFLYVADSKNHRIRKIY